MLFCLVHLAGHSSSSNNCFHIFTLWLQKGEPTTLNWKLPRKGSRGEKYSNSLWQTADPVTEEQGIWVCLLSCQEPSPQDKNQKLHVCVYLDASCFQYLQWLQMLMYTMYCVMLMLWLTKFFSLSSGLLGHFPTSGNRLLCNGQCATTPWFKEDFGWLTASPTKLSFLPSRALGWLYFPRLGTIIIPRDCSQVEWEWMNSLQP